MLSGDGEPSRYSEATHFLQAAKLSGIYKAYSYQYDKDFDAHRPVDYWQFRLY